MTAPSTLAYQTGFGNEFATEALEGALPVGRNSPQRVPHGLFAELISGTAFTVPRASNLRTWTYRLRPSAGHPPFEEIDAGQWRTSPCDGPPPPPHPLRWGPVPVPETRVDFVQGIRTVCTNGDASSRIGAGIHLYHANESMTGCLVNADGEMLLVPEQGRLRVFTELGILELGPGEVGVINRGLRFRVELLDGIARGYICENYGAPLRLPELGPLGSNGLANPRDFRSPIAAFEDTDEPCSLRSRFEGRLWECELSSSPLNVVAWHGSYCPYKYDLFDFNAMGTVSFDHPDPSIYTVLTSPTDTPGLANLDFVIFPPRWLVAEGTFRPPWYHRNVMSEFMGLIKGVYDAKPSGFVPGGFSLHNAMTPHGPDAESYERAVSAKLEPQRLEDTMAFMFETRLVSRPTHYAMSLDSLQKDYWKCWQGLHKRRS